MKPNSVDLSEFQDPHVFDYQAVKDAGIDRLIIREGHGLKADKYVEQHIANAKKYGFHWHLYHYWENVGGEANYAVRHAQLLGLTDKQYFFLDMEGNLPSNWNEMFADFRNEAKSHFKVGLYCSDSPYRSKFSDSQLKSLGVARWIASYDYEPKNYDIWQLSGAGGGGFGSYKYDVDRDYDANNILIIEQSKPDKPNNPDKPSNPDKPIEPQPHYAEEQYRNIILQAGYDTETGIFGLGCSYDNGKTFRVYWTIFGRKMYQEDADRLWPFLEKKISDIKGGSLSINWSDIQNKPDFALKSDIPSTIDWGKVTNKPDLATQNDLKKIELTPGPPGKDGSPGVTPHIDSATGHWFIGSTDTGVSARGPQGQQGIPGTPGADGKTSYFHIAYANSADGKDGFYIGGGVNLLQGTGTASGDVANGSDDTFVQGAFNGYDAVKTNHPWTGQFINLQSALGRTNAKAGDWYTISVYVKADKQIDTSYLTVYRARDNLWSSQLDNIWMTSKPITTQWQQYSWSFQIDDNSLKQQNTRVEYNSDSGDNWIYWAGWMLEKGKVAHPWSPAPSEAHPIYMGTYVDYTQESSLDPTSYQWSQIKGPKGDKGDTGANTVTTITSGTLADLASKTGVYHYEIDFVPSDEPAYDWGLLDVIVGEHYAKQVFTVTGATGDYQGNVYVRVRNYSGQWHEWREITSWN